MPYFSEQETPEERKQREADEAAAREAAKHQGGNERLQGPAGQHGGYNSQSGFATDRVTGQINSHGGGSNFLTDEANQVVQGFGGGAGIVEGTFTGDLSRVKEGIGNVAKSAGSALSAAPLRNFIGSMTPKQQYMGGSKAAADALQQQYALGIRSGNMITDSGLGVTGSGVDMLGVAGGQAVDNRMLGLGMYQGGADLAGQGINAQNAYLSDSIDTAGMDVASVAAQQQRMATDAQGRQMQAMAASARGGNQAAAMRNASALGSQNALVSNQQIAAMRLQEEQARRAALGQAQQNAAAAYGTQAQLGFNQQNQGLGYANTATGQLGGFGGDVSNVGLGVAGVGTTTTGQYLDAQTGANKSQLESDTQHQKNKSGFLGGLLGGAGKVMGGLF